MWFSTEKELTNRRETDFYHTVRYWQNRGGTALGFRLDSRRIILSSEGGEAQLHRELRVPHPWSCWRPGSSRRSGSGNPRRCCQRGPPRSAQLASPDSRGLWARGAAAVGARGRRCPHLPASSPRSARSSCFASLSSVRARERSLPKKPLDTSITRGAEGRGSARTTRQRSRQAALRSTLEPAAAFETAPTHAPLAPRALARSAASNSREERRRHLAAHRGAGAGSGGVGSEGSGTAASEASSPWSSLEPRLAWNWWVPETLGRWCRGAAGLHGARRREWVPGRWGSSVPVLAVPVAVRGGWLPPCGWAESFLIARQKALQ